MSTIYQPSGSHAPTRRQRIASWITDHLGWVMICGVLLFCKYC